MSLLGDIQKCTVYFWRLAKNLTSLELIFSVECGESQIGEGFDSRKFVVFVSSEDSVKMLKERRMM